MNRRILALLSLAAFAILGACGSPPAEDLGEREAEKAGTLPPFGYHDLWGHTEIPAPDPLSDVTYRWSTAAEMRQVAGLSAATGAKTNRVSLNWLEIEPTPPCVDGAGVVQHTYSWGYADAQMDAQVAAGVTPIVLLSGAPSWAAVAGWVPGSCGGEVPPVGALPECKVKSGCAYPPSGDHLADFRAYAESLMLRYLPRQPVLAVEVWNEPNFARFWAPRASAPQYVKLLEQAFLARNAAQAATGVRVPLVLGGLLPARATDEMKIAHDKFLARVYEQGGKDWFDGIGAHPYPNRAPWVENMWARLDELLEVRNKYKDQGKPLYITEVGVGGSKGGDAPVSVNMQHHAKVLIDMYRSMRGRQVKAFIFFSFREWSDGGSDRFVNYGVLRQDISAKPAFCGLAAKLGHTTPALCAGQVLPPCHELGGNTCEVAGSNACSHTGPRSGECLHCCGGTL